MVRDLYRLNAENRDFLHTRFFVDSETLGGYKEKIKSYMYPDVMEHERLDVGSARKVIIQYVKARNDIFGELELMTCFVESGTQFTVDYGDIDEAFYNSLESMFARILQKIEDRHSTTPGLLEEFIPRLELVKDSVLDFGWCYYDNLCDGLTLFYEKMAIPDKVISGFRKKLQTDDKKPQNNRKKILEVIKEEGPVGKTEIIKRTGLEMPEYFLCINELLLDGTVSFQGGRRDRKFVVTGKDIDQAAKPTD